MDEEIKQKFDFVLLAVNDDKGGRIDIEDNTGGNLQDWFRKLNFHKMNPDDFEVRNEDLLKDIKLKDYEVKEEDGTPISLLTFNFQLNQLLMLINNPLLFPHRAYARLFNSERKDT
ncbi:hypothetical protein [Marinicrinis lubricantis]|uniref:Uncharacterized protein n=1 Tax=Marinicrinis lubricantis TaxID=2086470 RepID=A0ABW1IMZ7_9BACL